MTQRCYPVCFLLKAPKIHDMRIGRALGKAFTARYIKKKNIIALSRLRLSQKNGSPLVLFTKLFQAIVGDNYPYELLVRCMFYQNLLFTLDLQIHALKRQQSSHAALIL